MKKKNSIWQFLTNIYVKNLLLMLVISIGIVSLVLVSLTVYTKHDQFAIVPTITGLQVSDAAKILNSSDLKYEVVDSVFQEGGVPGVITDQIPKGKTTVKTERTIYLTIQAISQPMVAIPLLEDYSQRQAEAQLNALGFNNITIEEVPSKYAGIFIALKYKGKTLSIGQKIPRGSALRMTVGAGGETNTDNEDSTKPNTENTFF